MSRGRAAFYGFLQRIVEAGYGKRVMFVLIKWSGLRQLNVVFV
jgi:hypothetical protein